MARDPRSEAKIDLSLGEASPPREIDTGETFQLLVIGDFSGRSEPSTALRFADRDEIDSLMAGIRPSIEHPVFGRIEFKELEDFHPDRLLKNVKLLGELLNRRNELKSPRTFRESAAQMQELLGSTPEPERSVRESDVLSVASGSLLDLAVEQEEALREQRPVSRRVDPFSAMLRDLVAPYVIPKPDPEQEEMVRQMERAIAGHLRALLHYPEFQELESAWRGLDFLVRDADTGENLKIYILDLSRQRLDHELRTAEDVRRTVLLRALTSRKWAVVCCLYSFGLEMEELALLGKLMMIARAVETPILAAARPSLLGCDCFAATPDPDDWREPSGDGWQMWQALRRMPEAVCVGLAAPRFLLRLPYGQNGGATELFQFEETTDPPEHEAFLWGNPALACAALLCRSFSAGGWDFHPDSNRRLDGLPFFTFREGGETVLKPVAEAFLTDKAAQQMMEQGVMPLLSARHEGAALLGRFQSISAPVRALAARWRGRAG
jgi:type VI secretion system protein ImpC